MANEDPVWMESTRMGILARMFMRHRIRQGMFDGYVLSAREKRGLFSSIFTIKATQSWWQDLARTVDIRFII